jgi:hypothetical protein
MQGKFTYKHLKKLAGAITFVTASFFAFFPES